MDVSYPFSGLFRDTEELERRCAPRAPADASVCCVVREPRTGCWLSAAIRDLSRTGIALLTNQPFAAGQLLTIGLRHVKSGLARKCLVEVCHADICYPNDAWLHGCRFALPLSDDELQLWL